VHLLFRNLRGLAVGNIILLYSPSSSHVSQFLIGMYFKVLRSQSKLNGTRCTQHRQYTAPVSVCGKVEMCVVRVQ